MPLAHVVVRAPFGQPGAQREDRGGPVQGLDLGLLVHTEHQGALRGVEVEAHHVTDLFDEQWIGGELEGVDQVRFEPEGPPDAAHRSIGSSRSPWPSTASTSAWRRWASVPRSSTISASTSSSVIERGTPGRGSSWSPSKRCADEASPPLRHRGFADPEAPRHLAIGLTVGALEHDATPQAPSAWALFGRRAQRCSVSRSSSLSTSSALGLPRSAHGCLPSSPMRGRTRRISRKFLYLKESLTHDTRRLSPFPTGALRGTLRQKFCLGMHTELLVDGAEVVPHRTGAQVQGCRNVPGSLTTDEPREDLPLAS